MSGDITPYLNLVTSEHADQPKFIAFLSTFLQPFADMIAVAQSLSGLFDLDQAVGVQLDIVGQWVGQSRNLSVPISNVYFSLDSTTLGLDQGYLQGPYDPSSGIVSLDDATYRTLLRAKIASNHWDGTIPGAYAVLAPVFPGDTVFIQDNQDMTMYIGVVGPVPLNAITTALFTGGYLSVKPAGVRVLGYVTPSTPGTPVFGLDADNSTIGGLDHGSFASISGGN